MPPICPAIRRAAAALGGLSVVAVPVMAQEPEPRETIETSVRTADGKDAGVISFEQTDHGVLVTARLKNLAEGPHGFHIHETGACTPDFTAAGGHYDPLGAEHGFHSPGGYHVGDLPNIRAGADGTAEAEFFVPQVTLTGPENDRYPYTLADADGSAIMIHAEGDDYRVMASSGGRVACGVIVPGDR